MTNKTNQSNLTNWLIKTPAAGTHCIRYGNSIGGFFSNFIFDDKITLRLLYHTHFLYSNQPMIKCKKRNFVLFSQSKQKNLLCTNQLLGMRYHILNRHWMHTNQQSFFSISPHHFAHNGGWCYNGWQCFGAQQRWNHFSRTSPSTCLSSKSSCCGPRSKQTRYWLIIVWKSFIFFLFFFSFAVRNWAEYKNSICGQ